MSVTPRSLPWAIAREGGEPAFLGLALDAGRRAGVTWVPWPGPTEVGAPTWIERLAGSLDAGHVAGIVLFTPEPAWWALVANQCPRLRAVAAATPDDLASAARQCQANALMAAGSTWTFFECVRVLRLLRPPLPPLPGRVGPCSRRCVMRIAEVIGNVTLARCHPALAGARWVIAVPTSLAALAAGQAPDGEDVVVFDERGSGLGSRIGISEGAEAAMPFRPVKKPIDAYVTCLLQDVILQSPSNT